MVLGLAGLLIGRLGETTWAPETERTAEVDLTDPGPAVVIDPGVLYVGGTQGDVKVTADSDVSVITASNDDISAYLDGVKHTEVTGLSDWGTLSTKAVDGDKDSISDPTSSDLWRSVKTSKSPTTIDIAGFHAEETSKDPQPYRAILLVTDGSKPGADSISITWPVDEKNEWVPFAYAAGATLIIVGLVMLVVSFGASRRERERENAREGSEELETDDVTEHEHEHEHEYELASADASSGSSTAVLGAAAGPGAAGTGAAHVAGGSADDESDEAPTHENVDAWQLGDEPAGTDPSTDEPPTASTSTDEPPTASPESATAESATAEQRPVTSPIPVGGDDGSTAGHDDAEGSEDPTEVIARIEEPIAGPGEDASAALPRLPHRHRAATPAPESGESHPEDAQDEGPEHGSDTEEEQR